MHRIITCTLVLVEVHVPSGVFKPCPEGILGEGLPMSMGKKVKPPAAVPAKMATSTWNRFMNV